MPERKILSRAAAARKPVGSYYHPTPTTTRTGACHVGQILRSGYRRKAYTRADGTRVKASYVPPRCVKSQGLPGKTMASAKVLPRLRHGELTRYGYRADKPAAQRLKALKRSAAAYGYRSTVGRVVAIMNYSKHNPRLHRIYKTDLKNLRAAHAAGKMKKGGAKKKKKTTKRGKKEAPAKRKRKTVKGGAKKKKPPRRTPKRPRRPRPGRPRRPRRAA